MKYKRKYAKATNEANLDLKKLDEVLYSQENKLARIKRKLRKISKKVIYVLVIKIMIKYGIFYFGVNDVVGWVLDILF